MKSAKNRFKPLAILTLVLIAGTLAWWFFLRGQATPKEIIALSGRIESDDAAVAAKTPGRIREITVREGDQVKAGQVIATLDDDQIKSREDQERRGSRRRPKRKLYRLSRRSACSKLNSSKAACR